MKAGAKGTGSAGSKGKGGGKITKKKKSCLHPHFPPHLPTGILLLPPPRPLASTETPIKKPVTNTLLFSPTQFIINASQPASDKIFDVSAFEKFLHEKIKVDNRVGNLGDTVQISQQGEGKIEVVAHTQFSGRYLKYLYVISFSALAFWLVLGGPEGRIPRLFLVTAIFLKGFSDWFDMKGKWRVGFFFSSEGKESSTSTLPRKIHANSPSSSHGNRTKKFLKKQQLRDWLRVVSTSQGVYELRFFNVANDEADEDDE
ncbi:MAG: hypothetical protein Q9188_001134 [Gyalolechia gomerana]